MAELAPNLHKAVPKRTAKRRTVAQALHNSSWTQDIKGARTVVVDSFVGRSYRCRTKRPSSG
jgi:hypothetical protein